MNSEENDASSTIEKLERQMAELRGQLQSHISLSAEKPEKLSADKV